MVHGYEVGQHHATILSDEDAILTYVDKHGGVCIIPVEKVGEDWFKREVMIRATQNFAEHRNVSRQSAITNEGTRAIQRALKKKAPRSAGEPSEEPPQDPESGGPAPGGGETPED